MPQRKKRVAKKEEPGTPAKRVKKEDGQPPAVEKKEDAPPRRAGRKTLGVAKRKSVSQKQLVSFDSSSDSEPDAQVKVEKIGAATTAPLVVKIIKRPGGDGQRAAPAPAPGDDGGAPARHPAVQGDAPVPPPGAEGDHDAGADENGHDAGSPRGADAGADGVAHEDFLSDESSRDDPPPKTSKGKGRGKKSKATTSKASKTPSQPRPSYILDAEQEEQVLEWMREHDEVWRRGHRLYKQRKQIWAIKADELGVSVDYLEKWWKSIKDWYVKLRKLPPSGSAARLPTDREKFILEKVAFYSVQQTRSRKPGAPTVHLARSEPSTAGQAVDSDAEDQPAHSDVPSSQTQQDGDLVAMETEAAHAGRATSSSSSSRRSQLRNRDESEDKALEKICQILEESQTILKDIHQNQSAPVPSVRESFIQYLSNILKTVSNEEFNILKQRISSVVDEVTQLPVSVPAVVTPAQRAAQSSYTVRPTSAPPFTPPDVQQQQSYQAPWDGQQQQQQQGPFFGSSWGRYGAQSSQSSTSDYSLMNIGQSSQQMAQPAQHQRQSQASHTVPRHSPLSFDLDFFNNPLNTPDSQKKSDYDRS